MFHHSAYGYVILIGDIVCLSAAYFIALDIAVPGTFWAMFALPFNAAYVLAAYAIGLSLFLVIYLFNRLYGRNIRRSRTRHLLSLVKALLIGTGATLIVMLLIGWDNFAGYGQEFLVSFFTIAMLLAAICRLIVVPMLVSRGKIPANSRRLLIVGGDKAAQKVVTAIRNEPESGLVLVGIVDDYKQTGSPLFNEWINLGRLESISDVVNLLSPDEILIAIDKAPYPRIAEVVDACISTGRVVRVFSDRLRTLAGKIGAEEYLPDIPVIRLSQTKVGALSRFFRRITDVTIAGSALVLLSPVLLGVGLAIKFSSPGPIVFRQTRYGMNGRPFEFYKFRTMHVGAGSDPHQAYVESFIKGQKIQGSPDEHAANVYKISNDPRTFPFGRFIRRTSIDELPQLVNVLKGDMELIGPRPCLPYEWESYEEWHKQRLSVVPGCTGLWQVFGRSSVTFEDMVIMDLYYIRNRSLVLDFRILCKTVSAMLFAKGGF